MASCSCKIAHQTHSNEVQQERRKIVKLLLRKFPSQESSNYHNMVEEDEVEHNVVEEEAKEHNILEDDEEEHPHFQEGDHLTQYAPLYPYEEQLIGDKMNFRPILKTSDKTKSEISRFEHALSTILLPPPIDSEPVNIDTSMEATEDNADIYYQGYSYPNNYPRIKEVKEDNADHYYEAYVHPMDNVQITDSLKPTEDNAHLYYEGYNHPTKNLEIGKPFEEPTEDNADKYYHGYFYSTPNMQLIKSLEEPFGDSYYKENIQQTDNHKFMKSFDEPTEENADEYYEPYMYMYTYPYKQYAQRLQEWEKLPELGDGNMYEGPMDSSTELRNEQYENEIFDVPKTIVKLQN